MSSAAAAGNAGWLAGWLETEQLRCPAGRTHPPCATRLTAARSLASVVVKVRFSSSLNGLVLVGPTTMGVLARRRRWTGSVHVFGPMLMFPLTPRFHINQSYMRCPVNALP